MSRIHAWYKYRDMRWCFCLCATYSRGMAKAAHRDHRYRQPPATPWLPHWIALYRSHYHNSGIFHESPLPVLQSRAYGIFQCIVREHSCRFAHRWCYWLSLIAMGSLGSRSTLLLLGIENASDWQTTTHEYVNKCTNSAIHLRVTW